ncbi:MAG: DNA-3-methyladenine glycosylase I [archaeon]|nr:MAG: DNA-3-methyladenine glycosylase I [archaeon]
MPPSWKTKPASTDDEYLARMSRAMFAAGLNWRMIENKWPNFMEAFEGFSPAAVSKMTEKDVSRLMKDTGIVRNEKKVRATIHNAGEVVKLKKEFGSFKKYLDSFGKEEDRLQEDLQERFHHIGPSSARMFLWLAGYPLAPNREEKSWIASHEHQ